MRVHAGCSLCALSPTGNEWLSAPWLNGERRLKTQTYKSICRYGGINWILTTKYTVFKSFTSERSKYAFPSLFSHCSVVEVGASRYCVEIVERQGTGREFHLLFPTQRRLHDPTVCLISGSTPNRYLTTYSQFTGIRRKR